MMIACYFHEEVACIIRNAVSIGCLMLHLFVLLVPKLSGDDDDDDDEPLVLPSRSSLRKGTTTVTDVIFAATESNNTA
jgi:hypothetical protein